MSRRHTYGTSFCVQKRINASLMYRPCATVPLTQTSSPVASNCPFVVFLNRSCRPAIDTVKESLPESAVKQLVKCQRAVETELKEVSRPPFQPQQQKVAKRNPPTAQPSVKACALTRPQPGVLSCMPTRDEHDSKCIAPSA